MEQEMAVRPARPTGVTVLGALVVFAGVALLILTTVNLLGYYGALTIEIAPEVSRDFFLLSSAINYIVAIALLASGNGLLKLKGWAWWLAFLFSLVAVLRSIFNFYTGIAQAALTLLISSLTGLALAIIILGYLVSVKQHFR